MRKDQFCTEKLLLEHFTWEKNDPLIDSLTNGKIDDMPVHWYGMPTATTYEIRTRFEFTYQL